MIDRVLVVGVFDLFHRGHIELLKKAKMHGEELYIVINGDKFTEDYKRAPIFSEEDRLEILKHHVDVTDVVISNIADVKPYIEKFGITKIVHGDEWERSSYLKQICLDEEYLSEHKVELVYVPYYTRTSTSELIKKLKNYS